MKKKKNYILADMKKFWFVIVLAFFLLFFIKVPFSYHSYKCDRDFPKVSPQTRGQIYKLMMDVDEILTDHQIPYWAISGTLLGAIRHKGLIPWDDDVDLVIHYLDKYKLEDIISPLHELGLEIVNYRDCIYKIFPIQGKTLYEPTGAKIPWKFPFVDIFLVNRLGGLFRIVSVANPQLDIYPNWSLLSDTLDYPIQKAPFGPMLLPTPHNPVEVLKREYGDDCLTMGYLQYSHENERTLHSEKVPIMDFSPPEYIFPSDTHSPQYEPAWSVQADDSP